MPWANYRSHHNQAWATKRSHLGANAQAEFCDEIRRLLEAILELAEDET
jgi:hypothetical protein